METSKILRPEDIQIEKLVRAQGPSTAQFYSGDSDPNDPFYIFTDDAGSDDLY